MAMKVVFDPLNVAGAKLEEAVKAIAKDAEVTFHNVREESKRPVRLPAAVMNKP